MFKCIKKILARRRLKRVMSLFIENSVNEKVGGIDFFSKNSCDKLVFSDKEMNCDELVVCFYEALDDLIIKKKIEKHNIPLYSMHPKFDLTKKLFGIEIKIQF